MSTSATACVITVEGCVNLYWGSDGYPDIILQWITEAINSTKGNYGKLLKEFAKDGYSSKYNILI